MASEPPAAQPPELKTELSRELSLFHITMMGVGMMIGAGVFIGTGKAIGEVRPGGMLMTFAFNGLIAICTAMAYAELASAIPRAGGAYNYARLGFGQGTSFLAGWMEWFASSVAGSLYAFTFALYVIRFLAQVLFGHPQFVDALAGHVTVKVLAVAIAVLFGYINYRGVSETGKTGAIITIGQTATLALIAVIGVVVAFADPGRLANFDPFLDGGAFRLLGAMGLTYVAFEGFEVIAQAGDEAIEPKRNLPKAMLYSMAVVISTYLLCGFAATIAPGATDDLAPISGSLGFFHAIDLLLPWGGLGRMLVTLTVIFAATSALNATVFSATRASYALGRDGFLPAALARISRRRRVPHVALFASAGIVIGVALLPNVEDVAGCASIMFLLLFLIVNLCVIRIRRRYADELVYGYVMPLFPLFPILAIIAQPVLAGSVLLSSPLAWCVSAGWLAGGAAIYLLYARHHAEPAEQAIVTLLEPEHEPKKRGEYSILLPVANPDTALDMIGAAITLARAKSAELDLLHMVPIPDQAPLSDAEKYMAPGHEAIVEAMLYASVNVPATRSIRYCRNVARGILSAARQRRSDLIITGWRGRSFRREFVLGSTLDPILEQSPCDVAVVRNVKQPSYRRVLVPVSGGPYLPLALEMADHFADSAGGKVTCLFIRRHRQGTEAVEQAVREALTAGGHDPGRFAFTVIDAPDVASAILGAAERHDLLVMGASAQGVFRRMVAGTLPEEVAVRCKKPFIMVKAHRKLKTWIERWF
jgi:amino acid transporter/nucleotide-binding universal stress UspA family protein